MELSRDNWLGGDGRSRVMSAVLGCDFVSIDLEVSTHTHTHALSPLSLSLSLSLSLPV